MCRHMISISMLSCLLLLQLLFLSHPVASRPAHYAARYPQHSPDEQHRLFMMHVINQQFERVVEESGIVTQSADELVKATLLDNVHTQHLIDMAFHLAQWHMTPECGQKSNERMNDIVKDLFIAYHDKNKNDNVTIANLYKYDAIVSLYQMIQLGKIL